MKYARPIRIVTAAALIVTTIGGCVYGDNGDMRTLKRLAGMTDRECRQDRSAQDHRQQVTPECQRLFIELKAAIDGL
jgi:hypothetical protein